MENKYIFCQLFLFTESQEIFLIENQKVNKIASCHIGDIAEKIPKLCELMQTQKVKIKGNKAYAEMIAEDIKKYYSLLYHSKNIDIEVIE